LAGLPEDTAKQGAIQNYLNRLSVKYPQHAATLVTGLTDEAQRTTAIQNIAKRWLLTDPVAAERWLNTTPLPKDQIQQMLKNGKP
jgi:hypothetical protein